MRWVRWQGLIAFAAVLAVLLAFWYLFIDVFIERRIEKTGTSLVGAKVELGKADLSLFPLGLTLTGLQVTNPDEPMTNLFEVARISFTLDGANLIRKKYIMEEMAIDGVRLNTPRKSSGATGRPEKKAAGPEEDAMKLITFELPDIKEVLKKEDIESVKAIEDLRAKIMADRAKFEQDIKGLPGEKKIKEYKERIERLKRSQGIGGVIGGTSELLALRSEIEGELKRITALRDDLTKASSSYRERVAEAARAPRKDIEKIVRKYSFSPEGLANLSMLFIGGRLREFIENGLEWREKIDRITASEGREDDVEVQKPLRGKGLDVQFREYRPLPDFLIRKASVSISIPAGDIGGLVTNITGDQDILGSPMRIRLSGEKLKGLASAALEGEINRVVPGSPRDTINFALKEYRLHDFNLTDNKYVPVAIKEALADFSLRAEIKGESMRADIGSTVRSAAVDATVKGEKNLILETMASALSSVKAFNIDADVTGTLENYKMRVSSDLDRVLSDAVGGILRQKMTAFENNIRAEVLEKTEGPLKGLNGEFGGLLDVNAIVKERFAEMNGLLGEAARGALPVPKLPF